MPGVDYKLGLPSSSFHYYNKITGGAVYAVYAPLPPVYKLLIST
jgi:hypothetical protein